MNLINKVQKNNNSILSATKPETILDIKNTNSNLKTMLRQKKKIKIYLKEDKYYVDSSTAFALKLIKTRAIMLDKPRLIELDNSIHNKLKNDPEIEIEYIKIEKKNKIKVNYDGTSYSIDTSAAYAVGLIGVEDFYNAVEPYFYINENILAKLKNDYEVEFTFLKLGNDVENNKTK